MGNWELTIEEVMISISFPKIPEIGATLGPDFNVLEKLFHMIKSSKQRDGENHILLK